MDGPRNPVAAGERGRGRPSERAPRGGGGGSRGAARALAGAVAVVAAVAGAGVLVRDEAPEALADTKGYASAFRAEDEARVAKGAISCKQCHSKQKRRDGSDRDEYTRWAEGPSGSHVKAYEVLATDRSKHMARILGGVDGKGADPLKRADCLGCHSFGTDPMFVRDDGGKKKVLRHGEFFESKGEGVSCESCHGRSGGIAREFGPNGEPESRSDQYLDEHQSATWRGKDEATWRRLGQFDTRKLENWAAKCLECHLGVPERRITHAIYAAGHPELQFELSNDVLRTPHHWRDSKMYLSADEARWFYGRLWAVGQAVYLREAMEAVLDGARTAAQPSGRTSVDYAVLDCFSCHHELRRTPSFNDGDARQSVKLRRQELGYLTQSDEPGWQASAWATTRHLVALLLPGKEMDGEKHIRALIRALSVHEPDWAAAKTAATALRDLAQDLAKKAEATMLGEKETVALLHAIAGDSERVGALGYRAADQALRAIYTLYKQSYARTTPLPPEHEQVMAGIDALRAALAEGPTRFDPYRFGRLLQELGGRLPPRGE